jgi:hypothetical protein
MRYFYEGRAREPAFVFATKLGLWMAGGQDIAVSIVSGVSSTLLVPATFLLGFELGGPLVGLPAALLVALDPDLVSWSTMDFRDDFFALATRRVRLDLLAAGAKSIALESDCGGNCRSRRLCDADHLAQLRRTNARVSRILAWSPRTAQDAPFLRYRGSGGRRSAGAVSRDAWVREGGVPRAEARVVAQGTLASAALFLIVFGAMYALSTAIFVNDLAK